MTIEEYENAEMTEGLAYITGMIFPLYKFFPKPAKRKNGKYYICGSVNHNEISAEDLAVHFKSVLRIISNLNIDIFNNTEGELKVSSKKGFSIVIDVSNNTEEQVKKILQNKVLEIEKSSENIKKEFFKACFDCRGSWDTSRHYFSVDVDRDYEKQDLMCEIFSDFGIDINQNRREQDYEKNDQLRIKSTSIKIFLEKIGLFSECRKKILIKALEAL